MPEVEFLSVLAEKLTVHTQETIYLTLDKVWKYS